MVSDAKVVDIFIDSLCFFVRPREEIFKKKFFFKSMNYKTGPHLLLNFKVLLFTYRFFSAKFNFWMWDKTCIFFF